ncbi:MAG: flagellar hook assembly protein FlgD [Cohaesibacteraceae bacterium]
MIDQLAAASTAQADQARSDRDQQMLADDFDAFLQLLTTQLRNQDPTDPLDTNEFTNQLVQFSGIEQQIQTNSYMESLIQSTEAQAVNAVVGYLGAIVQANGTTTGLVNGTASWTFDSPVAAENSTVTVLDENGKEVFSGLYSIPAGESVFSWDGLDSDGEQLEDGTYTIRVAGNTANGDPDSVQTGIVGRVSSIEFQNGQPVLKLGDIEVQLSAIKTVAAG